MFLKCSDQIFSFLIHQQDKVKPFFFLPQTKNAYFYKKTGIIFMFNILIFSAL